MKHVTQIQIVTQTQARKRCVRVSDLELVYSRFGFRGVNRVD